MTATSLPLFVTGIHAPTEQRLGRRHRRVGGAQAEAGGSVLVEAAAIGNEIRRMLIGRELFEGRS